jgi:hypothetical protein
MKGHSGLAVRIQLHCVHVDRKHVAAQWKRRDDMMTRTQRIDAVVLESIGLVDVSLVTITGDGHIRPYEYLEIALLWGENHCWIVDSNIPPSRLADAVAAWEMLCIPELCAAAMLYVLNRPNYWDA